jgi:hypothetical protein
MSIDLSEYQKTDRSVYNLKTIEQANSLRELILRSLSAVNSIDDYFLKINSRSDGLYDLLVFQRVN